MKCWERCERNNLGGSYGGQSDSDSDSDNDSDSDKSNDSDSDNDNSNNNSISRDCWCVAFGNSYNNTERSVIAGYDNGKTL